MRFQNRINCLESRCRKHSYVSTHIRGIKGYYISFKKEKTTPKGNCAYTPLISEAKACVRDCMLYIHIKKFPTKQSGLEYKLCYYITASLIRTRALWAPVCPCVRGGPVPPPTCKASTVHASSSPHREMQRGGPSSTQSKRMAELFPKRQLLRHNTFC